MRWLCGLEVAPQGLGPLEAGAWLARHGLGELEALTVVPEPPIGLSVGARSELLTEARALGERRIAQSAAAGVLARFSVVAGRDPSQSLCKRAAEIGGALIVGRHAPAKGTGFIRLGRVARRVLRRLPGPTCVVPPDWRESDAAAGPVVVGVDARIDSLAAIEFGRRLAVALGRTTRLVHVVDRYPTGIGGSTERGKELRERTRARARDVLEGFLREHRVDGVEAHVVTGSITSTLVDLARREQACAVVVGSRRLSTPERIFSASIGSQVASASSVPVFVVPKDEVVE